MPASELGETPLRTSFTHLGDRYVVELSGDYPFDWVERVAATLALAGVNIFAMDAKRVPGTERGWTMRIESDRSPGPVLSAVDRAMPPPALPTGPATLALTGHLLVREGDLLVLTFRARDEVGLLSAMLRSLAMFGLFPAEVSAVTQADEVRDSIRLTGLGGSRPSEESATALRRFLERG